MVEIVGRLTVQDFDTFWEGFRTRGAALRERHGCRGARVLHSTADSQQVLVVLTWTSEEDFQGFRSDPEVQESMRRGGALGPPEFSFYTAAGELPA